MADIQENPYGVTSAPNGHPEGAVAVNVTENPYATFSGPQQQQLIVQKSTHLPHMPSELRHTNYSSSQQPQPQQQQPVLNGQGRLANPQVLEHHRDSANFSLTSSDSG